MHAAAEALLLTAVLLAALFLIRHALLPALGWVLYLVGRPLSWFVLHPLPAFASVGVVLLASICLANKTEGLAHPQAKRFERLASYTVLVCLGLLATGGIGWLVGSGPRARDQQGPWEEIHQRQQVELHYTGALKVDADTALAHAVAQVQQVADREARDGFADARTPQLSWEQGHIRVVQGISHGRCIQEVAHAMKGFDVVHINGEAPTLQACRYAWNNAVEWRSQPLAFGPSQTP